MTECPRDDGLVFGARDARNGGADKAWEAVVGFLYRVSFFEFPPAIIPTNMSSNPSSPKQIPSPTSATPSSLAALLAESYHEVESLRRELAATRKRADKAERLAASLQALQAAISPTSTTSDSPQNGSATTSLPESATRILMDFEDRAVRAEVARDEAEARKRVLMDTWTQLESYLAAVSEAAADARAGYGRIVFEGGGQLVLGQIPTLSGAGMPPPRQRVSGGRTGVLGTPVFPPMALPPHPHPTAGIAVTGSRRPRSPSMDGYHQPPSKKSRGDSGYLGDTQHFPHPDYHYPDPHAPQHTYPPPPPPRPVYRAPSQSHHPHQPPRMILPPAHQHQSRSRHRRNSPSPHRNSRSRSSSSDTSLSVDEMLLQASTGPGDENGAPPPPPPVNGAVDQLHQRNTRRSDRGRPIEQQQQQQMYPQHHPHHVEGHVHPPQYPQPPPSRQSTYRKVAGSASGPEGNGNGSGEFQTHIFAPPVTGAPTKKSKYQDPPVPPPHVAGQPAPGVPFPAVNEQGQRICRQCGVAGRYKEGKCVEKWGPGPLGPGTVCDRCRKKMKRVERRGTMDTQQLTNTSASTPTLQHPHQNNAPSPRPQTQSRSVHRTDTIPATQSPYNSSARDTKPDIRSPIQSYNTPPPPPKSMRPPPSPPPAIAALNEDDIPTSEIGRGSEAAAAAALKSASSRSSSRNGHVGSGGKSGVGKGGKLTPTEVNGHVPKKTSRQASKSPLAMEVGEEVDADGDAEAEAEVEAEIEAELDGVVGKRAGAPADVPMEVDAEVDLLEAVDAAAEANSSKGEEDDDV